MTDNSFNRWVWSQSKVQGLARLSQKSLAGFDRFDQRELVSAAGHYVHSGANRVYEAAGVTFTAWDGETGVQDATGRNWSLQEATLVSEDGAVLHRLPAQRAFRFGWFSAYNHTRLVQ